jgi:hypothetical protein
MIRPVGLLIGASRVPLSCIPAGPLPPPTMDQRRTQCIRRAYELARSGAHEHPASIEVALMPEFPEAREWLRGSILRDNLRQVCELSARNRAWRNEMASTDPPPIE